VILNLKGIPIILVYIAEYNTLLNIFKTIMDKKTTANILDNETVLRILLNTNSFINLIKKLKIIILILAIKM